MKAARARRRPLDCFVHEGSVGARLAELPRRPPKEKWTVKKSVPIGTAIVAVTRSMVILLLTLLFHVRVSVAAPQSGERVYSTAADSIFVLQMSDSAGTMVGMATGFLVADNLVLTNAHVANAGSVSVRLGSFQVPCVTKRVDPWND